MADRPRLFLVMEQLRLSLM